MRRATERSNLQHLPPVSSLWLGIDLGGTSIKCGVVDDNGRLLGAAEVPTEASGGPRHVLPRIVRGARLAGMAAGVSLRDCAGIGVGCPGPLDVARGVVHFAPNLPGWSRVPLARRLVRALGGPVVIENDANCAAWGEGWIGAGRGVSSFILYTLGTGVGGGIVLDGVLRRGDHGAGAELGHVPVAFAGGRPCGCGSRGCLEAYAGTAGLQAAWRAARRETKIRRPSPREIFDAARSGDRASRMAVEQAVEALAAGIAGVVAVLDIGRIVIGGGMAAAGPVLFKPLRRAVARRVLPVPGRHLEILPASLGSRAGIVGAAGWARHTFATSASSRTSTTGRARSRTASSSAPGR